MASQWFYELMGERIGPVSSAELVALAQRGTVTHDTSVRKGADGNWVPAKRVRGLFCVPNTTSVPLPTVASAQSQKQPVDTPPQQPSRPLASNIRLVSATLSGEGVSQFAPVGNVDAICPYCNQVLVKKPGRKKKCPFCGQFIYVRTRPSDKQHVLATETQVEQIEEQWSVVNGTHDTYLLVKRLFAEKLAEEKAKLANRYGREPSDNEVEVSLLREAFIENAERQLEEFEATGSGIMAEWLTAGDNAVCKLCAPLHGIVLTTEEARGLMPRHDECRCCWTPANVGERDEGQKRTKKAIDKAIDQSVNAEVRERTNCAMVEKRPSSNWRGATVTIDESRPQTPY
jgi:uncharacterized Zn finger protein (UPF0148 family)